MSRDRGLLAFLCTLLVVAGTLFQVPLVNGTAELGRFFTETTPEDLPPLAIHLAPADIPQLPRGPGQTAPVILREIRRDKRPDEEILDLAKRHHLPFALLKAHLAITSRGVASEEGIFWPDLPQDDAQVADEAVARTRAAAALLADFRRALGSVPAALLAWEVGLFRARRVAESAAEGPAGILASARLRLPAFARAEARQYACSVLGMAVALQARWPVPDPEAQKIADRVELEVSPGQAVASPMAGQTGWVGNDGSKGLCVEIEHVCDLRSVFCGLKSSVVSEGQQLRAGSNIGLAGQKVRFWLFVGRYALDGRVLRPDPRLEQ